MLTNPRGRKIVGTQGQPDPVLIHIGDGERVHAMNPLTGRALCAPKLADVSEARGDNVTCYRCQHLMQLNRSLRGGDMVIGDARKLVAAARNRTRANG